jgi:hypothetical protein
MPRWQSGRQGPGACCSGFKHPGGWEGMGPRLGATIAGSGWCLTAQPSGHVVGDRAESDAGPPPIHLSKVDSGVEHGSAVDDRVGGGEPRRPVVLRRSRRRRRRRARGAAGGRPRCGRRRRAAGCRRGGTHGCPLSRSWLRLSRRVGGSARRRRRRPRRRGHAPASRGGRPRPQAARCCGRRR